ncbi:hypothetical protein BSP_15300 [Brevundimonas sp. Bb-A]|jgi:hypothetical protein|nr:hypothetical protein BSP_15300 [Brevundimonas sp. Bb-A]
MGQQPALPLQPARTACQGPFTPITRWQGTMIPAGLEPLAGPAALADLGYPYVDETTNPACRLFLDGT